jgi:hypothetical protein
MRSLALVPVLVLTCAACSGPAGRTATYSAGDDVPPRSPLAYTGAPRKTGSSTRGMNSPAPAATAPSAPSYAQAPAYTPPPTVAYTPPAPTYQGPTPSYQGPAPTYQGPTPAPAPAYTPPPPPAPTPAPVAEPPATAHSGSFIWARSLDEARALARSQNKLIFLETGRDACGNCQKLRNQTIPELSSELAALCVGYYDDCDRDRNSEAFGVLYRNLPGAASLPLVGWVTADLRWVHGFSGGRDATRFRQDMQTAQATWKQMATTDAPRPAVEQASLPDSATR